MNKRLLTLSMVGLLTMTLASCSDVKKKVVDKKEVVVSIGDTNYTADDLLAKYGSTTAGVEAYYNAIYDILIRNQQEIDDDMKQTVSTNIDSFIKEVKRNASTNGTTFNDQRSKDLEAKGVKSLEELNQVYTLQEQKTKYEENWYEERINYKEQKDDLVKSYIQSSTPYHVRHILVKTENAGTSLYDGKISEAEALKLASVVERLAADNETFGQVAQQSSDDSGSAAIYGSIGIVDQDSKSGFVSEFKYGVYAYDAYFDGHGANSATPVAERAAKLNIPTTIDYTSVSTGAVTTSINVKDTLSSIAEIPYKAIEDLREYADKINTEENLTYVPDKTWANNATLKGQPISESYYPRNIIFNNYFNDHGLYVVVDDGSSAIADSSRFKSFDGVVGGKKILVDEKGNPVLITRGGSGDSYQGVHFMIIEQSPFWYDEANLPNTVFDGKAAPSTLDYLRYYYSTDIPQTSSEDVSKNQKYVTYVKSNRTTYSDRADAIEDAVKSYNSNIKYEIFKTLVEDSKVKFVDNNVKAQIDKMIESKIASAEYTKKQSNLASWKDYVELLKLQDAQKAAKQISLEYIGMYDSSYVPTAVTSI